MNGNYTPGYPSLAAFIARDRDKSTLIFKRFDRLAARNLLHLQSELARLQAKLDDMDVEDATEGESSEVMENKQCLRSWDALVLAAEDNPRHKERLELAKLIKDALKDYSEFVNEVFLRLRRSSPKAGLENQMYAQDRQLLVFFPRLAIS